MKNNDFDVLADGWPLGLKIMEKSYLYGDDAGILSWVESVYVVCTLLKRNWHILL